MLTRTAKRIVVAVIGGTVLLIGIVMIVLPGPAILVVPAGLAILATEFLWARRLLRRVKIASRGVMNKVGRRSRSLRGAVGSGPSGCQS